MALVLEDPGPGPGLGDNLITQRIASVSHFTSKPKTLPLRVHRHEPRPAKIYKLCILDRPNQNSTTGLAFFL